jgi:hypothetical protein
MNMGTKRSKGIAGPDAQDILAKVRECRKALTILQSRVVIKSIQYRQAGAIISELDELGYLITGKSDYFLQAAPSTPKNP